MKRRYAYSISEMTKRLLKIAAPIKKDLLISTLASITGSLSHMGLMGFGALWIMTSAGYTEGNAVLYACLMALSGFLIALCRYLEGVYSHQGAYGVLAAMRVDLFRKIDRISPAYITEHKMGDILNIAVSDIETLEFFFAHTIGPMFTVILLPLTSLLIAAHYDIRFALLLIPVYLMISVIIPWSALQLGRGIGMRLRTSLGELKAAVLESVYGIRDIQIFHAAENRKQKVRKANDDVNRASHAMVFHQQTLSSLPNFFVYAARILIILTASLIASEAGYDPAGTVVVSCTAAASFSSTFSLTFVVSHLLEAFASAERLFLIEDTVPAVAEAGDAKDIGSINVITFNDVSFAYPKGKETILSHTDLTIRKGERIGLIGESGIGKSTLLRLLMRFYDPSEGSITFNGIDLKTVTLSSLHDRIALLEQDTYLFHGTIRDNIAIAKADASDEEIQEAVRLAGLEEFIETLPDGLMTDMGEMSARLSGGERQRVGIARVLLKHPDIIVMDEPTSSLDALHEKELLNTLKNNYRDATVIIVSHRMSTLADCTRLLKMENGKIVEAL